MHEFRHEYKIKAGIALAIGLILCALSALFPPRQATQGGPTSVPRVFIFSSDINVNVVKKPEMSFGSNYPAEIDSGRLLAECILIASVAGLVSLYFCLGYWYREDGKIWTELSRKWENLD